MPVPTLSVVIPATDRPVTLGETVRAVLSADEPPEQLVVVEDPPEAGPAEARNLGAEAATGDVVVFVDSDVVVHPDAFTLIRESFGRDPGLAALFGSYDDAPRAPGLVSRFRNLLHHHIHQRSPGPATTFWAGLGAVRRPVLVASGGFDPGRFPHPSVEDVELGVRLAERGDRVLLDPRIQGTHLKRWGLVEMVWTDFARRGIPWTRIVLEHGSRAARLNLGPARRLSACTLVCALGLVAGRRNGPAAGLGATYLAVNGRFYLLLVRKLGAPGAGAGVALHALHHLVALAAAVAGGAGFAAARAAGRTARPFVPGAPAHPEPVAGREGAAVPAPVLAVR